MNRMKTVRDLQKALSVYVRGEPVKFRLGEQELVVHTDMDIKLVRQPGQPDHVEIKLYEDRRK